MESRDEESKRLATAALGPMREAIDEGRYIFCDAPEAEPGADCWNWLRSFIGLIYDLIKANRLTNLRIIFTFDERGRR